MKLKSLSLIIMCCFFGRLSADAQPSSSDTTSTGQEYREKFYPNGNPMYQGTFRDGVPVGEMKRYYENGVLQAILDYDENGTSVRARLFYEDGNLAAEGLYINMLKDSIWEYYSYYDGQLASEETYHLGKLDGPVRTYYSSGNVSEVVEWKDGERNGLWEQYFEGSRLRLRASFRDDQLEGEFAIYFEDGSPSVEGNYSKDKPHGRWTFYHEDGTVAAELDYQNGKNLNEAVTDMMQDELFQRIEENMGRYEEPDETEFLMPSPR